MQNVQAWRARYPKKKQQQQTHARTEVAFWVLPGSLEWLSSFVCFPYGQNVADSEHSSARGLQLSPNHPNYIRSMVHNHYQRIKAIPCFYLGAGSLGMRRTPLGRGKSLRKRHYLASCSRNVILACHRCIALHHPLASQH